MKGFLSKLLFFILLIIFCISGTLLFQYARDEYQYRQLEQQIEEERITLAESQFDFSNLIGTNDDIIGWIVIEGTSIDYPVVQGEDNSYYLTHDINQVQSKQGSIFMDYRNSSDLSDNHSIIYGHNMKSGAMFHDLNKYSDQDFFKNHSIIDFYSLDGLFKWEIFSTYITDTDFNYLQTAFDSNEVYLSFINNLLSKSQYQSDVTKLTESDKVLTLSTCSDGTEDSRRVVHARLIEEAR